MPGAYRPGYGHRSTAFSDVRGRRTGRDSLTLMEREQRERTKARETEIRGIWDQLVSMFSPEGGFMRGAQAEIERTKQRDVASATQQMISSGLYGSTGAAGIGKKWEEDVGMPARLRLEDLRYAQLAKVMGEKAGFVERIEDMLPDYSLLAQLRAS